MRHMLLAVVLALNAGSLFAEGFEKVFGGCGQSLGYTVRATADGGCVLAGHTTVNSAGSLDLLLVKVAPQEP